MDPLNIIAHFYPDDTPLRRLLLHHSFQVRDKALELLRHPGRIGPEPDVALVTAGALLHDIGIRFCHAPGILCMGEQPYLAHGIIGARMLREYGEKNNLNLEPFARICERHTGSGLSAAEIRAGALPLPEQDFLPETPEEQLICLADKFFSKSGDMREKSLPHIRRSMLKFGQAPLARFDALCRTFGFQPEKCD